MSVYGVVYYKQSSRPGYSGEWYAYEGYQTRTTLVNDNVVSGAVLHLDPINSRPDGFDGDGWYHVRSDGSIIEKCPYSDDVDVFEHHDIRAQ